MEISRQTGLSDSYYQLLGPSTYVWSAYDITPAEDIPHDETPHLEWFVIPRGLTDELQELPWEHVFGQGVLVRDCRGRTALVSIGQAAVAQLNSLTYLLESLVSVIDDELRAFTHERCQGLYKISWKHRNYFPSTAVLTCSRTADGTWVMGVDNKTSPQRQLLLDIAYVLDWLNCVFYYPQDMVGSENLVVHSPADIPGTLTIARIENTKLWNNLGLNDSSITAHNPGVPKSEVDTKGPGCWRNKIRSGVVLSCRRERSSGRAFEHLADYEDSLVMTAGGLWALFDNSLSPIPDCSCTFRSDGGDFVSCQARQKDCYIWHLQTDENDICGGKKCKGKTIVAFSGYGMLNSQTICILGWPAHIRSSPKMPIASKVSLSPSFLKSIRTSIIL